jgi:hypothetical protein
MNTNDCGPEGPAEPLLALAQAGFSVTRVAGLLGMNPDDLSLDAERANREVSGRLHELGHIVVLLRGSLSPAGMEAWFEAGSRYLDGRRPVDLLREGDTARVREAAEALADGTYL